MGNMITAHVVIRGTRPFWQHKFGPEALSLEKKEKTGVAGNDPEEWRRTCSISKDGQLYFDATYVFGTLKEGGKYTKSGRMGTLQSKVAASLQVTSDRVLLDRYFPGYPNGHAFNVATEPPPTQDSDAPVYLDIRGVRNPSTKARNVRYRIAAATGWQADFGILWDKTIVSRGEMEAVINDAGKLVGIGNGRSVGMGRFEIVSLTVSE